MRLKLFTADIDSVKKITITSNPENPNEIILQAIDTFAGKDGEEVLTINNVSGLAVKKIFNSNQLLEILSVFEETEFFLYHAEDFKVPCCIDPKPEGTEESIFNFIIASFSE